ncbi:MAG TPA: TIGR03790 family protein [Candidatus Binatus sp.]|nr:TIGR03790 family protein [Candidatus Binatus sp.]
MRNHQAVVKYPLLRSCFLLLIVFLVGAFPLSAQNPLAQSVLVVYDPTVSDSVNVANHYLSSRGIPNNNVCLISPPESGSPLSWSVFVSTVQSPIQSCLNTLGPNQILYIVLSYIRPFSLTAQNGKVYAMDSYLEDIWNQYATADVFPYPSQAHPYFAVNQAQGNSYAPFLSLANYRAQPGSLQIYSVWRLDGATAALAQGLVDQAIAAEKNGLAGQACLDREYGPIANQFDAGDGAGEWSLHMAAVFAGQAGFSVTEDDNPQEFGTPPAPDCPNAALYSGWYSLDHYNNAFTWNTGAIGFHLDSLSAADPRMGSNWSANAIQHGITATSGAVAEPYLQGLAQPDGVFLNLLQGANLGDAFLRNEAWLKWMILNIGDPLYLPFPDGLPPFSGPNPQTSLLLNPQFVVGPLPSAGTVTLASPAPAGGTVVYLSSSKTSIASVPASVTVPEGATQTNFSISTAAQKSNTFLFISASGGVTQTTTLGVVPLLGGISLIGASVVGGGPVTAAVVLNNNAPAGGTIVALTSSKPSVLPVPANVTVPAGSVQAVFTLNSNPVSSNTTATIEASLSGTTTSTSISVTQALASLDISPDSALGGKTVNGTVRLTGPAYPGGVTISLTSSDPSVVEVPPSITIAAGATQGLFGVTTAPVSSSTPVTIAASSGSSNKSATLTLTAPLLSSMSLSPSSVLGGTSSTGTVKLTGIAPINGISLSLTSSDPSVAMVPASVSVPSGENSATFNIDTSSVSTSTPVTITASLGATTKKSTLSVTPPR